MRPAVVIPACAIAVFGAWGWAVPLGHAQGKPDPAPVVHYPIVVSRPTPATATQLRAQLVRERRAHRIEVRTLRGQLRSHPDFQVSLQLAGIVYHQDWHSLEACALSEGARRAERFTRYNARPNSAGSGATGAFQFMRGTFLSTPFAGLDWTRQDVQAFAAAYMWSVGRRREWAGVGC